MIKNTLRNALIAGSMLFGAAIQAHAVPITWTLEDVTFTDGASASGSFTIDTDAQIWWDFSIATTAGPSFSAFIYDATNSRFSFGGFGPNSYTIIQTNGARYLTFSFEQRLPGAGGTVALNSPFSWECYNCSPWRNMTGSVTTEAAEVPEPATLAMMLPALGMLGWMSRRRRKAAK